jgi:ATP-dependent DNA helicase RecG
MEAGEEGDSLSIGRIVPIYPGTEGISQNRLRKIIYDTLERYAGDVTDPIPPALRIKRRLIDLPRALRRIHFPADFEARDESRRRLVYDELLVLQLLLAERKQAGKRQAGITFADVESPLKEFAGALPFALTEAQARVLAEIAEDMHNPQPMNRLVQGDVGSGKTAVAMGAMLVAVRNGYQAALMAPTEILAEQHLKNLRGVLEDTLGIRVDLLTGSIGEKTKRAVRERVASGDTGVVVGTHALIQEGVSFHRLGLAVVDEQHRFGVLQRAALSGKGANPDILVMTATPIPRTLTLTVYGDLDVSIIDALPPGRKPVKTHWKRSGDKDTVYEGIRKIVAQGRQAYVVCPLVEESEKVQSRAATELAVHLAEHVFPELQVGLLHGQMSSEDKDAAMARFRANETQILVATTVIEVGVDVPNAAVMVIEDADRFGLAQLHQLRGRVGRGQFASFCVLLADPKTPVGEERMRVLTETGDGFKIAEADLRLRGPGEFYGVRQSGVASLHLADVLRDGDILAEAREDAFNLLAKDKTLTKPENRALREAITQKRRQTEIVTAA